MASLSERGGEGELSESPLQLAASSARGIRRQSAREIRGGGVFDYFHKFYSIVKVFENCRIFVQRA